MVAFVKVTSSTLLLEMIIATPIGIFKVQFTPQSVSWPTSVPPEGHIACTA